MSTDTGKESTTKAGSLWQALHTEREFSAAYFNAILANNSTAITDALEIIDMSPDDVELSEEEYSAFVHGRTPSGELEVTAWGGYYVTHPLPNGKVFALLIRSFDNRVYWGPEEDFADKYWSKCEVDYSLGSNATLCFSSSDGDVTLSFSCFYEDETGEIRGTSVEGTIGNTEISANKRIPPLPQKTSVQATVRDTAIAAAQITSLLPATEAPLPDDTAISAAQITSLLSATEAPLPDSTDNPDESKNFLLSSEWRTYTAIIGIVGSVVSVVIWCCPGLRRRCIQVAQTLRRRMHQYSNFCIDVENSYLWDNKVDLSLARETLRTEVIQNLNEKLQGADFDKETVEQIIERLELKKYASTELEKSIQKYIQDRLAEIGEGVLKDMPSPLDDEMKELMQEQVGEIAQRRTKAVIDHFGEASPGILAIVTSTVLDNRKEYYQNKVGSYKQELEDIEEFIEKTSTRIQECRDEIEEREKEAERLEKEGKGQDATSERQRIRDLEVEIKKAEKDIKEKQERRTKTEGDKEDAEKKSDEHNDDIERDEGDWEKEANEHIK